MKKHPHKEKNIAKKAPTKRKCSKKAPHIAKFFKMIFQGATTYSFTPTLRAPMMWGLFATFFQFFFEGGLDPPSQRKMGARRGGGGQEWALALPRKS